MRNLAILLSSASTIGLVLYIVIDENNIQVLMVMKILGRVQKRARNELKAFLVLFGQFRHADLVKWTQGTLGTDQTDGQGEMDERYCWDRLDRLTWSNGYCRHRVDRLAW